jgi:hypothetical protein
MDKFSIESKIVSQLITFCFSLIMENHISVSSESIENLQKTLTDIKVDIPTRFRSIFTLKAINNSKAIDALAAGIKFHHN